MNIAMSSDDNYAKYLLVSIVSILESNKMNDIHFYVIDNGISNKYIKHLNNTVREYHQKITIIKMKSLISEIETDNSFPLSAYSRLFLTNINSLEKVIYLDCDTITLCNLIELWNFDLENKLLAGIFDPVPPFYREVVNLNIENIYINSGVLLMNLKEMRKFSWNQKVKVFIENFNGSVPHHDQGIINGVAKEKVAVAPLKFNVMDNFYCFTAYEIEKLCKTKIPYSSTEYESALFDPAIIHFTTGFHGRVWDRKCTHPQKNCYYKIVDKVGYDIDKFLVNEKENLNTIIMRTLYNKLPFKFYWAIMKIVLCRKRIIYKKRKLKNIY